MASVISISPATAPQLWHANESWIRVDHSSSHENDSIQPRISVGTASPVEPATTAASTAGQIDQRDLLQIALKISERRLPQLLDKLSTGSVQASAERERFHNSARWLDEAANKLAGALGDSPSSRLSNTSTEVQDAQKALVRDRNALTEHANNVARLSENLGAAEAAVVQRLRVVIKLIKDLTKHVGLTDVSASAKNDVVEKDASDDSSDELDPLLARYFDKLADAEVFEEHIGSLKEEFSQGLLRREQLRDQGVKLPDSDDEFRAEMDLRCGKLDAELRRIKHESDDLKLSCVEKGLDLQQARWRTRANPEMRQATQVRDSQRHLRNWLEAVETTGFGYGTNNATGTELSA